ncbi:hypothetical protein F5146DRAFT_1135581 [Armillaria mellea]|nr:hypothetical protein F5146DRAFT_1135581 [Armillaria mellea]
MSFPGMEDTVTTSPVTVDDHTVDNSVPLIQDLHLQQSMTPMQYVFPDRTDIRAWNGDIPFCLWHDEGALKNYCADYSQQSPGTDRIPFDLGIAHKHTDTSKVCFSVSTSQFWEIYQLSCAIPDNNLPQLVPTTGFILNVSPTLPASPLYEPISQREHSENVDTVNGLAHPGDNETSNHSSSPLAIAEQERDIRPLPHTSTRRRGTAIRDHTLSTLATAAKRKVPDSAKTQHNPQAS